ncbi:unnamed protein product [Enterobius vermicularis]|uniref:Cysteine protease n=1 Tax=Enterobius vermicularis TaxID=51028 RepID=A0A158QAP8_ENTVE|nr:unnamed protein product [Enterobius vermicularis]
MLESCLTFEPYFSEFEDYSFFDSRENSVYVFGHEFKSRSEMEKLKNYVMSRLWFTYRKNFRPIGGTGPTSDQGWGCMLRCGQMLLAQALIVLHLGPNWIWNREKKEEDYKKILRMFQDDKNALYSLHQIAQMGVSEKKEVGEWFGPNTVAQVLKKLTVYDDWSKLAVHVALDNLLIESDVEIVACSKPPKLAKNELPGEKATFSSTDTGRENRGQSQIIFLVLDPSAFQVENSKFSEDGDSGGNRLWRPLLIIVPLRLGLTTINRCYLPAIQEFFRLPQCAGIIGGRPNHALYFIGIGDEEMVYLDPHVCQPFINLSDEVYDPKKESAPDAHPDSEKGSLTDILFDPKEECSTNELPTEVFDDTSYHCPCLLHVSYSSMDPSLALAFICPTKEDYEDLSTCLREKVLKASVPPIFEILKKRPAGFPEFVPYVGENAKLQDYTELNDSHDSFDEFEMLE